VRSTTFLLTTLCTSIKLLGVLHVQTEPQGNVSGWPTPAPCRVAACRRSSAPEPPPRLPNAARFVLRQHARRGAPKSALPACPHPGTRAAVRPCSCPPARRRTGRPCPAHSASPRPPARASPIKASLALPRRAAPPTPHTALSAGAMRGRRGELQLQAGRKQN
jgi:hypothetical protein